MEINKWVGSCKVRSLPWTDGKRIYVNVQYYAQGQSVEQPPVWDKAVYVTDNAAGRRFVYELTDTLVEHVSGMNTTSQYRDVEITITL